MKIFAFASVLAAFIANCDAGFCSKLPVVIFLPEFGFQVFYSAACLEQGQ